LSTTALTPSNESRRSRNTIAPAVRCRVQASSRWVRRAAGRGRSTQSGTLWFPDARRSRSRRL
jgi:hypothetical protein